MEGRDGGRKRGRKGKEGKGERIQKGEIIC